MGEISVAQDSFWQAAPLQEGERLHQDRMTGSQQEVTARTIPGISRESTPHSVNRPLNGHSLFERQNHQPIDVTEESMPLGTLPQAMATEPATKEESPLPDLKSRLAEKNRPLWNQLKPKPLPIQQETIYPQQLWQSIVKESRTPRETKQRVLNEDVIAEFQQFGLSLADEALLDGIIHDLRRNRPQTYRELLVIRSGLTREQQGSLTRMLQRASQNGLENVGDVRKMDATEKRKGLSLDENKLLKATFGDYNQEKKAS